MPNCSYCESSNLILRFQGMMHPFKKDHGPFDIYRCNQCRSLITYPLPSKEQQAALYALFKNGLIPALSDLREQHSLSAWYEQCIDRAVKQLQSSKHEFTWIDVGAGSGTLALKMAQRFPNSKGFAIDFHERPVSLAHITNVDWISCDMNEKFFAEQLSIRADLVMSITVLEHMIHPDVFLQNIMQLMKRPGVLYLTVPCTHSFTSVILGKKWPYIIPGEHLTVPSKKGMHALLKRLGNGKEEETIHVKQTILPYTAGYYLDFLKLKFLKKLIPSKMPVRLPTGILEASMIIK